MSRYPFPIPFGWFQVAYPEDVPVKASKALFAFDRHLVAWRDEEEALHVQDAFCPHLGAHLGHGGTVENCRIQCPFHGWEFDGEGTNVEIPYSTRTNKRARIRTYPVAEVNGKSLVWFHPDPEVGPLWQVPPLPELEGDEWFGPVRTEHTVLAHPQELGENAVDSAHFRYVHNVAEVPEITSYITEGPIAEMKSLQKFPTPRGVVEGKIESLGYGPGVSVVRFAGIIDTLAIASTTPIDTGSCVTRFDFYTRSLGDAGTDSNVAKAFVQEVDRQFMEDMPVWEHKAHISRPALADTDGPFMTFRKWYQQFYADVEPEQVIDPGVHPPPYWPDKMDETPAKATASARHSGAAATPPGDATA